MKTNTTPSSSKSFRKHALVILVIIVGFYALSWLMYGLEYVSGRKAVLSHYGGVAQAYTCGGAAVPTTRTFSIRPRSFILPAISMSYEISAKNDGIASGYVTPFGQVVETEPAEACLLQ